jgi:type IV secretion system protein VirD4
VHSLVVAPTGAGKGVGIVIPSLLTYPGSTVVLDVKGGNYEKTAGRRQQLGDRVFKFAPYAKDRHRHRYNAAA